EYPQRRDRIRHDRGLGVLGEGQFVLRPLAHQLEEMLAERLVDLLKHLAGCRRSLGERLAHADRLAALTRKDECAHDKPLIVIPAKSRDRLRPDSSDPGFSPG